MGLFRFDAFDLLPLEEVINRNQTAAPFVGVTEARKRRNRFRLGIDRLAAAISTIAE